MKKAFVLVLFCLFATLAFGQDSDVFRIDSLPSQGILLDKNWKFKVGDNLAFAKPDFDDSKWESIAPTKDVVTDLPQLPKDGKICWFRLRFSLDSSINQPLAVALQQSGASEIYLNGKLIKEIGILSQNPTLIKAYNPYNFPISISVNKEATQILAIRYALQPNISYGTHFGTPNSGFTIKLNTTENAVKAHNADLYFHYSGQFPRIGIFVILGILFFTLYLFFPIRKANLYFSLYAFINAISWWIFLQKAVSLNFKELLYVYNNLVVVLGTIAHLLMLTSVYSIFEQKRSWFYWFMIALGAFCIPMAAFVYGWGWFFYGFLFSNLINVDITRVALIALRNHKKGTWIILVGGVCYLISWVIFCLQFVGIIQIGFNVFEVSILSIPITFAIFLGYDVALNNRLLEKKLIEVETLSSEKQQILENQKEELEKQVKERTVQLKESNEELHSTNEELHKKNEDITASITYAKRIQTAMLPRVEDIQKALPESFVLFKPRDIVSGDFYYFKEKEDKIIIACADCTGHGVPGAFMSMIGNEILTNIVEIQGITSPDLILNELHKNIRTALKQGETENRDGMDISIITLTKTLQGSENFATFDKVEYAGAMNPLYYVASDFPNRALSNSDLESRATLKEIKADKFPIGGSQKEQERTFTKHTIQLEINTTIRNEQPNLESGMEITTNNQQPTVIYLCSDGFQDQFGGAQGKKFMVKKFRELLFSIHHLPMNEQRQILDDTIESWMAEGNEKQIDDILVVGIRI